MNLDDPRERIITPRVRGYVHREIVTVVHEVGMTESGEVIPDLAQFASENTGHIWLVDSPAWILTLMLEAHGEHPCFNYQIITSMKDEEQGFIKSRVTRFGFRCKHEKDTPEREACPYRSRRPMHTVWSLSELSQNPGILAVTDRNHETFMELAQDIRDWCRKEDIPLPSTLAGIANSLLRDERFWPEARGRVPRATNENVRRFLPGVYGELLASRGKRHNAISLDQRTAYHVAAQETPIPDSTTLFARGYFDDPHEAKVWAFPGDPHYIRTMSQPGIVYVLVDVTPKRKNQVRPPAVKNSGRYRIALWTNEIALCEANGVTIRGIIAAWTSTTRDTGLPRYGAYAQREVTEASAYRKRWLKPTLHALYGLLATNPRRVKIGHLHGTSEPGIARIGFREFAVSECDLGVIQPLTANVAAFGTLQAEIRKRSFELARYLSESGVTVLHIHADGIHVEGEIPLLDPGWTAEPLNDLEYLDSQSWVWDGGDHLPGRDARARMEVIRHRAKMIRNSQKRSWKIPDRWVKEDIDTEPDDKPMYWPDGTKRYYVTYEETQKTPTPPVNRSIRKPRNGK